MKTKPCYDPSAVLAAIRERLVDEVVSTNAPEIAIKRSTVVLIVASLTEQIDALAVLEESSRASDRIAAELRLARADILRLEQELRVAREIARRAFHDRANPASKALVLDRTWDPTGKGALEAAHRRSAEVVDLTPILAREHREAGRPVGPEGGAA